MPHPKYQKVKDGVPIVEYIGRSVKLTKVKATEWRGHCPHHTDKTPSFYVIEERGSRRFYHCFSCGRNGNVIDFYAEKHGTTNSEAADRLLDMYFGGGVEPSAPPVSQADKDESDRKEQERQAWRQAKATEIWSECEVIRNSRTLPAAVYLFATRKIDIKVYENLMHNWLRFHPNLKRSDTESCLAIVARGFNGETRASESLHRTFLLPDGTGKAEGHAKLAFGGVRGLIFPVYRHPQSSEKVIHISEGLEDFLSYAMLHPCIRGGFSAGINNIANIKLPDFVEEVVIIGDAGDNAKAVYDKTIEVFAERGIKCSVQLPPDNYSDFNDYIRREQ